MINEVRTRKVPGRTRQIGTYVNDELLTKTTRTTRKRKKDEKREAIATNVGFSMASTLIPFSAFTSMICKGKIHSIESVRKNHSIESIRITLDST